MTPTELQAELNEARQELARVSQELQSLKGILAEFEDSQNLAPNPADPLVTRQSLRAKIIDGFVEGWGPAAPGVSPGLRARYPDIEDESFWAIAHKALPHTALSVQRLYAIYLSVGYIVSACVPGDIVECGVFKGGSALMIAESLHYFGDTSRGIFLFDTFTGWPAPTDADTDFLGQKHKDMYDVERARIDAGEAPLVSSVYRLENFFERARAAIVRNTSYPEHKIRFVTGLVEQTLPCPDIGALALLRLDTDYYESTRHEMDVLWPRLSPGGILLVDDYGQFRGARRAIDEYLAAHGVPLLLHRDDVTGRTAVKPRE